MSLYNLFRAGIEKTVENSNNLFHNEKNRHDPSKAIYYVICEI